VFNIFILIFSKKKHLDTFILDTFNITLIVLNMENYHIMC